VSATDSLKRILSRLRDGAEVIGPVTLSLLSRLLSLIRVCVVREREKPLLAACEVIDPRRPAEAIPAVVE